MYALGRLDQPPGPAILANPDIDGVALHFTWGLIEPVEGRYDWSRPDEAFAGAARAGKKVSLGVVPGVFAPAWVYAAGAASVRFRWDKPWGFPACSQVALPVPWDGVYAAKWLAFVAALGRRYGGNPALAMVKIQGVNAQTGELLLPHAEPSARGQQLVDCPPGDDVSAWLDAGYRPAKVLAAWRGFALAYAQVFPHQKLVLDTGPWGLPGIGDSGRPTRQRGGDRALPSAIVAAGAAALGDAFVVANNGLSAKWDWPRPSGLSTSVQMGYETASPATGDAGCRMNHFQRPCDPRTELAEAVQRAVAARVSFLGIYVADIRNPALADVIADAHRRLATP